MNPIPALRRAAQAACLLALLLPTALRAEFVPHHTTLRKVISLHVKRDGTSTLTTDHLIRIDTPKGVKAMGERQISYAASLEDVEVLEAWTIRPDGSRIRVSADRIRTQDDAEGSSVFSDAKLKVIVFPALEVGSRLHYRAVTTLRAPFFPGHFFWSEHFTPHHRYEEVTIHLTQEPGVNLKFSALGMQGGPVSVWPLDAPGTARHLYRFRQTEVHPPEEGRVALVDFAPHLAVTTFPDYASLARAYQSRARPKAEVTPAIARLAAEITAGVTSPKERMKRLYQWVSRNIRYAVIYAGAGGYVPHEAQSVLDNRHGDCKDHVVLLEALLRAVGIESSPALVNLGDSYRLPTLPIVMPLNHVITYVPRFDLFLDSTAQFAPMGALSPSVVDKPVLIAATGKINRTPPTAPDRDFTHEIVRLEMGADGSLTGRSITHTGGQYEVESRQSQFEQQDQEMERNEVVTQWLGRYPEPDHGEVRRPDPEDLSVPWAVQTNFELGPVVNLPGPAALALPIGLGSGDIRALAQATALPERRYKARCVSRRYIEEVKLQFPEGVRIERIPPGVSFSLGPLRYESRYRLEGQVVHSRREYVSRRTSAVCGASDDRDFDALLQVVRRDLRGQVFLR